MLVCIYLANWLHAMNITTKMARNIRLLVIQECGCQVEEKAGGALLAETGRFLVAKADAARRTSSSTADKSDMLSESRISSMAQSSA